MVAFHVLRLVSLQVFIIFHQLPIQEPDGFEHHFLYKRIIWHNGHPDVVQLPQSCKDVLGDIPVLRHAGKPCPASPGCLQFLQLAEVFPEVFP